MVILRTRFHIFRAKQAHLDISYQKQHTTCLFGAVKGCSLIMLVIYFTLKFESKFFGIFHGFFYAFYLYDKNSLACV